MEITRPSNYNRATPEISYKATLPHVRITSHRHRHETEKISAQRIQLSPHTRLFLRNDPSHCCISPVQPAKTSHAVIIYPLDIFIGYRDIAAIAHEYRKDGSTTHSSATRASSSFSRCACYRELVAIPSLSLIVCPYRLLCHKFMFFLFHACFYDAGRLRSGLTCPFLIHNTYLASCEFRVTAPPPPNLVLLLLLQGNPRRF